MRNKMAVFGVAMFALVGILVMVYLPGRTENSGAGEKIKKGEYLVTLGGCNDCHSPKVMTERGPMPDPARLLSGHPADEKLSEIPPGLLTPTKWGAMCNHNMTAWTGPWGVSFAANLTPDEFTGTGAWKEETFIAAMRSGKHMGAGRPILPPMPWFNYAKASDEDLGAIFAYLKSLKPIENMVPPPIPPAGK